jgi:hypothetical protein
MQSLLRAYAMIAQRVVNLVQAHNFVRVVLTNITITLLLDSASVAIGSV